MGLKKKGFEAKKEKAFKAEMNDSGQISGYFSTYDKDPDSYGDIVAPGRSQKR